MLRKLIIVGLVFLIGLSAYQILNPPQSSTAPLAQTQSAQTESSTTESPLARLISISSGEAFTYDDEGQISGINPESVTQEPTLTLADEEILRGVVNVEKLTPFTSLDGEVQFSGKPVLNSTILAAVGHEFLDVFDYEMESGEFFSQLEETEQVVVVGTGIASVISGEVIGQTMRINGEEFRVVGVLESLNAERTSGVNFNRLVLIPPEQARKLNGGTLRYQEFNLIAETIESVPQVVNDAQGALMLSHGKRDFVITSATR